MTNHERQPETRGEKSGHRQVHEPAELAIDQLLQVKTTVARRSADTKTKMQHLVCTSKGLLPGIPETCSAFIDARLRLDTTSCRAAFVQAGGVSQPT